MRVVIFDKNDIDNSGATQTLKLIIRLLVSNGHSISVVVEDKPTKPNYDGQPLIWKHYADKAMNTADLVIAQHFPCGILSRQLNRYANRPMIYICNFTEQFEYLAKEKMKYDELLVCMSNAMKDKFSNFEKLKSYNFMTLYPQVSVSKYSKRGPWSIGDERKKYITFINSNFIKGANLFYEIAKKMPEREFLVVKAYYLNNISVNLPNIKFVEYNGNVGDVYDQTYLLLCPSLVESWSRVSNEAMCNGIPVLYSKPYVTNKLMTTEGMDECVGTGGIALEHDKVDEWIEAINSMDEDEIYEALSKKAYDRAVEIESQYQGVEFVKTCEMMVQRNPNNTKSKEKVVSAQPKIVMAPPSNLIRTGPIRQVQRVVQQPQQQPPPVTQEQAQPQPQPQQPQAQQPINPRANLVRGFVRRGNIMSR
jgi:hypothetical protein